MGDGNHSNGLRLPPFLHDNKDWSEMFDWFLNNLPALWFIAFLLIALAVWVYVRFGRNAGIGVLTAGLGLLLYLAGRKTANKNAEVKLDKVGADVARTEHENATLKNATAAAVDAKSVPADKLRDPSPDCRDC